MASHKKSILKTITWRIIATTTTATITWLVTGELSAAIVVGGSEAVVKMFLYYLHERAWIRVGMQ